MTTGGDASSTFAASKRMPIHRWFHYYAGFSAEWVASLLSDHHGRNVLDPFVGSGTTLIESERVELSSIGIESHPFVHRVCAAKLLWRAPVDDFLSLSHEVAAEARGSAPDVRTENELLQRCYAPETLSQLASLRDVSSRLGSGPAFELVRLALASCLRACGSVNVRQAQYLLPKQKRAGSVDAIAEFATRCRTMADDMVLAQGEHRPGSASVLRSDARTCEGVDDDWADLVVTSPPYANNFDYADATRLEMTFFGEIERWSDLQASVRPHLVRASTQHVSPYVSTASESLEDPLLAPIRDELRHACLDLLRERAAHAGKKNYHAMATLYFLDMASVWGSLRRVTREGATVCFVVGDSAPYGVHLPVERWFGELALASGFRSWEFEKIRDRNTKWLNRKHRVPLKEGRLWVRG